jgi:hypothetical protein
MIMKKELLKHCLRVEVDNQALKSYDEFIHSEDVDGYEKGVGKSWYQVTVTVLEKTEEYVNVMVSVSGGGWRDFFPLSYNFLVYRDGRVDK